MVVDDRSRIQDLGALNWGDSFQVPEVPGLPSANEGSRRQCNSRSHVRRSYQRHGNGSIRAVPR
jgi:hypothetical protein